MHETDRRVQLRVAPCCSTLEPGSASSRDMPKQSRIVEVWIARQQTKIAADDDEQEDRRERVAEVGVDDLRRPERRP